MYMWIGYDMPRYTMLTYTECMTLCNLKQTATYTIQENFHRSLVISSLLLKDQ